MYIPFGPLRPDVSDFKGEHATVLNNVFPSGDGYQPFKGIDPLTSALTGACRGAFVARNSDGSSAFFAATETKIYKLNNSTLAWGDVSKGFTNYTAVPGTDQWQFAQFGSNVFAVQANVTPQVFNLSSSSAFADLGGSPPPARFITVVARFLVLSGLTSQPFRIQWSGLNDVTNWTSGVNSSDYQDFSDGGPLMGIAGGETGAVFQSSAIRRMTYAPGSPVIFQIERVTRDLGLEAAYSLMTANDKIYFYSSKGFHEMVPTGYPQPIGREYFDQTFRDEWDQSVPSLMLGVPDPKASRVFWFYRTSTGPSTSRFDKCLVFDQVLRRATTASVQGSFAASFARPGTSLDNLTTGSMDNSANYPLSFDSYVSAYAPEIAVFNSSNIAGTLTGSNLEATLYTPEKGFDGEGRAFVRSLRPICDAATIYTALSGRETAQSVSSFGNEVVVDTLGRCPHRVSARYIRAKVRIPAATDWTHCSGVEVEYEPDGER